MKQTRTAAALLATALFASATPALATPFQPEVPPDGPGLTEGEPSPDAGGSEVNRGPDDGLGGSERPVQGDIDVTLKLLNAEIVKFDPNDQEDEFVEFVFGNKVLDINEPSAFKLIGVSAKEVVAAVDVVRNEKNPNALVVAFPAGIDPTDYVLASVSPGAVGSIRNEANPGDSIPLVGSKAKDLLATAVPKLVDVRVEPSLERIKFVFDQKLDESKADPFSFGFYSLEGRLTKASTITSVDDKTVIAKFDEFGGDQVEDAVRAVVLAGAVRDKSGLANPIGSLGALTTSPDLIEVYNGPARTQFDFKFDKDVTGAEATDFSVYTRLGKPYVATDARLVGSNIVRVTVPAVREFDDEVIFGTVTAGAVFGDKGFGTPSTVGGLALATKKHNKDDVGFVAGPELIDVTFDAKGSMVKFFFDEKVDDDQQADPDRFSLITKSGSVATGATFVDADDNWVVITFEPAAIKAAVAAMILADTVVDFEGNPNPPDLY